jgi:hypothetical protein
MPEARVLELKLPKGVLRSVDKGAAREIALDRALTALGRKGDEYAAVFRRPEGYFIARVDGKPARVNGKPVGNDWQRVRAGDSIQVGGDQYELQMVD